MSPLLSLLFSTCYFKDNRPLFLFVCNNQVPEWQLVKRYLDKL